MTGSFPGEQLLIKIAEILQAGIGAMFRPWQIRRDEAARIDMRRQERLVLEQTELDVAALRTGQKILGKDGTLLPGPAATAPATGLPAQLGPPNVLLAHEQEANARELQRAVNLRKIALCAEEEAEHLEDKDDVSEEPVDPDWFARWRSFAEDVTKEEMQRLWGRLLAKETLRPGSYTIHSMDFLARMSNNDADLIAKLAQFRIGNSIFSGANDVLARAGVSFADLIYLDDLNILNGVVGAGGLSWMPSVEPDGQFISIRNHNVVLFLIPNEDTPVRLHLPVYSLSRVAQEIMSLASFPANMDYVKRIAKFGAEKGFSKAKVGEARQGNVAVNVRDLDIERPRWP